MDRDQLTFLRHAFTRMFERGISVAAVAAVIETGEVIERHRENTPTPSRLVLGYWDGRPLHVVYAENQTTSEIFIITTYWPDPAIWEDDWKRRRP